MKLIEDLEDIKNEKMEIKYQKLLQDNDDKLQELVSKHIKFKENIIQEIDKALKIYEKDLFYLGKKKAEDISCLEFLKLIIKESNKWVLRSFKEDIKSGKFDE